MTESTGARIRGIRGHWSSAVLAVFWVGMGFNAIADERTWFGAAGVILGLLMGASWLWPHAPVARFMLEPVWRRKRPTDR